MLCSLATYIARLSPITLEGQIHLYFSQLKFNWIFIRFIISIRIV